jgi:hypothetical protein
LQLPQLVWWSAKGVERNVVDEEDHGTAAPTSPTVVPTDLLKQRNRILAVSLAGVSALVLVVAVTLAILTQDAGFRHVLAGL